MQLPLSLKRLFENQPLPRRMAGKKQRFHFDFFCYTSLGTLWKITFFSDCDIMKIYFYLAIGLSLGLCGPGIMHATENAEAIYARALQVSHEDTVKQAVKDLEKIARQHSEPARVARR